MKEVEVALLGFGTVGSGTFSLLQTNAELIENRLGVRPHVSKIYVRNPQKYTDVTLPEGTVFTDSVDDVLGDETIRIVVEVMGELHLPENAWKRHLRLGKM